MSQDPSGWNTREHLSICSSATDGIRGISLLQLYMLRDPDRSMVEFIMAVRFSMARSDNKSDVFFYSQFSLLLPQCEGHTTCRFLRKPQNGGVSLAFEYETQLMPCFSLQFCNEVFLVLCIFLRYLKKTPIMRRDRCHRHRWMWMWMPLGGDFRR